MASRTLKLAWEDFDKSTSHLNTAIIDNLKTSTDRWTVKQIDYLVDLLKSIPTDSASSTKEYPKFGTLHNALLWVGFSDRELFRIDPKSPTITILQGNLDFNVPFRIDIGLDGVLVKTTAPDAPTQSIVKKKFDSNVRTLQTFVLPHDRIFLAESDERFVELLRVLNLPIRAI